MIPHDLDGPDAMHFETTSLEGRVESSAFDVLGFRMWGLGFRVQGLFRVRAFGFRVEALFIVWGLLPCAAICNRVLRSRGARKSEGSGMLWLHLPSSGSVTTN